MPVPPAALALALAPGQGALAFFLARPFKLGRFMPFFRQARVRLEVYEHWHRPFITQSDRLCIYIVVVPHMFFNTIVN
jgi:hypothetical protein